MTYGMQPSPKTPEPQTLTGAQTQDVWLQVLNCAADAVLLIDGSHYIVFANPAADQMFRYPENALIGLTLSKLLPTANLAEHQAQVEEFPQSSIPARNTGAGFREVIGLRTDGSEFAIDATIFKLNQSGPNTPAMGVFLRDVTERKQAAQALLESEKRFRAIADYTNDWESWLSPEGKLLWLSPAVQQLTGYTKEECIWMTDYPLPIIHPEDRELARKYFLESSASSSGTNEQLRVLRKDGETIWVNVSWKPILDEHGCNIGHRTTVHDITQIKKKKQELRSQAEALALANAQLAKASKLKDEFLASMSHELRTPLTGILTLSEALQEKIHGPLTPKQEKYLKVVEESGRHLLALINDILDVAKIQSGRVQLERTYTDVEELCQSCVRLVRESVGVKRQRFNVSTSPVGMRVNLDSRRMKQVLVNLLGNAVKFTPEGGEMGLSVKGDTESIRFEVWDNGIGIAPDQIQNLFQPFVQLDSSLSREYSGTGLGLALVKQLVELHGGRVEVTSELGKGSRFVVLLPWDGTMAAPKANPASKPEIITDAPTRPQHKGKILLCEDNIVNVTTVRDYLEVKGYEVIIADNGEDGVAKVQAHQPDIILMDIQMPKMDGLEATRNIRLLLDKKISSTPIIALTALAMPGDRERCLASGVNDYLTKPVRLVELLATVQKYIVKT